MSVITNPKEWPVDNQEVRRMKGRLIRVEIGPGQYRMMYQADAERLGLVKAREPVQNKMVEPAENKTVEPEPVRADDFTTISGVGRAAARALAANGITTFNGLRAAGELDYLTAKVNQAIEDWRGG
jgi:predicted flap endonuclease-1-like 5' DNA nuclease